MNKKQLCCTILSAFAFLLICLHSFTIMQADTTLSNDMDKKLQALSNAYDREEVFHKINQFKQKERLKKSSDIQQRFYNAMILGDSITEGIHDYHVLTDTQCVGIRGARIDMLQDFYQDIERASPEILFLSFGMNDLEYNRGNAKRFIQTYEQQLLALKKKFPDIKIYINKILPMQQHAINKKPVFQQYTAFNEELDKLAKKYHITCIDSSFILSTLDQPYENDGIHPTANFYKRWAINMADIANLT